MTSVPDNSLDDIFGSSPPREHEATTQAPEPSDLPSLRRQHVTAGYRDGVSAAKGQHVQSGFDAGFPVGAQLGMRAGTVLGILEGVLRGYESRAARKPVQRGTDSAQKETEADQAARRAERERILEIYQRAVKELDVRAVFALDNAVVGEGNEGGNRNGGEEKPEVLLRRKGDVAVSKWEGRVQVALWEENMDVLEPKVEGRSATES